MRDIYKIVNISKNGTDTIYVFIGDEIDNVNEIFKSNPNDKIFDNVFSLDEKKEYANKKIEFIARYIHGDDTVDTIKNKILLFCDIDVAYEEIYLYYKTEQLFDNLSIINEITQHGKFDLSTMRLKYFLANIEGYSIDNLNLETDKRKLFTQDDIESLNLERETKLVLKPLGQMLSQEYPYFVDPYRAINSANIIADNTAILINTSHNNILMRTDKIHDNVIKMCIVQEVLKIDNTDKNHKEIAMLEKYVFKTYYPYLDDVESVDNLYDKHEQLISEAKKRIGETFVRSIDNVDLLYDIHDSNTHNIDYIGDETGINEIDFFQHSTHPTDLLLEVIFKQINSSEKLPLIKFNPGKRQENIYRLFTRGISTKGKKIPSLKRNKILKLSKTMGLTESISIYSNDQDAETIFEIERNGSFFVKMKPKKITNNADIEGLVKKTLNPIITMVNEKNANTNYKFDTFQTLRSKNIVLKALTYTWSVKISKPLNLNEKMGCLFSVFNMVDDVDRIDSTLRFKRIANFNNMDSQDAIIRELKLNGNVDEEILKALKTNFVLSDSEAERKLNEFYSAQLIEKNAFNTSRIKIRNNPGFLTTIRKDSYDNIVRVQMNDIDNIELLRFVHVYIDAIFKITQYDEIGQDEKVMKLCSLERMDEVIRSDIIAPNEDSETEDEFQNMKQLVNDDSSNYDSSDEDEDTDSDNDSDGGATSDDIDIDITGKSLRNPNPFFTRLESKEPTLFLTDSDGDFKAYSRLCPSNLGRQPVILTQEEKDKIDAEHAGSYDKSIKYSTNGEDYHYICPRYWSLKKNVSLTKDQVDSGEYGSIIPNDAKKVPPGGGVVEFTSSYHTNDKGEYLTHNPGFLNQDAHPNGKCIPCCFKRWNSTNQNKRRNDCLNSENDETNEGKEDNTTELNDMYIQGADKFPLGPNRIGHLPIVVQNLLNINSDDCQVKSRLKPNSSCILRYGVEDNITQSFLSCIADIYTRYSNTNMDLHTFKNYLKTKILNIDLFASLQNGNLIQIFENQEISSKKSSQELKKSTLYSDGDMKINAKIAGAYLEFKNFISDNSVYIDHKYLWDLVCTPNKSLFKSGLNLVIFEIDSHDITDNVRILCPTNHYSVNIFDDNKPCVMLLKKKSFFEPIYLVNNGLDDKIIVMSSFDENTMNNMPNIKSAFKFIKTSMNRCEPSLSTNLTVYEFTRSILLEELMKQFVECRQRGIICDIKTQILNYDGKVVGVLVYYKKTILFVPCYPSSPYIKIKTKYIDDNFALSYQKTGDLLNSLHTESKKKIPCIPVIKVIDEDKLIVGILTQTNQFVPVIPEIDMFGSDLEKINGSNLVSIDKKIITSKKVDSERVQVVRKIKFESNNYNAFRNVVRLQIGKRNNTEIKNEIIDIVSNNDVLYLSKLRQISKKIQFITDEVVCFVTGSSNDYLTSEENDLVISDENCGLIVSKYNLVDGTDNEENYFVRVADELIRYNNFNSFILNSKSFLDFGTTRYILNDDEIILLELFIMGNYFDDLIANPYNPYVKFSTHDTTQPLGSRHQDYEIRIDEAKITKKKIAQKKIKRKISNEKLICKEGVEKKINRTKWKKIFPAGCKIIKYNPTNNECSFKILMDLLKENNVEITVNQLKQELAAEYANLTDINEISLMNELRNQGKSEFVELIKTNGTSFESIITSEEYYATNIDIWLLAKKYNIPLVFYLTMRSTEDSDTFLVTCKDGTDSYYFVKSNNRRVQKSPAIFLLLLTNDNKKKIHVKDFPPKVQSKLETETSIVAYLKLSKNERLFDFAKK